MDVALSPRPRLEKTKERDKDRERERENDAIMTRVSRKKKKIYTISIPSTEHVPLARTTSSIRYGACVSSEKEDKKGRGFG